MSPVVLEIVTISPIMLGHCTHCEIMWSSTKMRHKEEQLTEYPEEILERSAKITEFIKQISKDHYITVKVIEALTFRGLVKMVRHLSGRLPLIIINGQLISKGELTNIMSLEGRVTEILSPSLN